jgi:hypothetical protein
VNAFLNRSACRRFIGLVIGRGVTIESNGERRR